MLPLYDILWSQDLKRQWARSGTGMIPALEAEQALPLIEDYEEEQQLTAVELASLCV